jgi:23S rRNA (pseudouridine1915-N3)-methyltransferase
VPAWVKAGYDDYARRMPRELPLLLHEIKPCRRIGDSPAQRKRVQADEKTRILAAIPGGSVTIALDERGKLLTTLQFSKHLETWMREGRDVCFVIGGADGLDEELKRSAGLLLALSSLTLPHALARVVLAEQLYRAALLVRNHPYHRQ